ncbi:MAG: tetratricopeptide repeat protein, partial [Acidobacteriota bacterium]
HNMANIVEQQGDIPKAMKLWQQSLDIKEDIGDAKGKAATLHEMAGIVAQQGDFPKAMKLWQQSLDIKEDIGDAKGKATTLHNMANIVAQQGDIPKAMKLWQQSLNINDDIGDAQGKAATLASMAWAAGQTGDADRQRQLNVEAARMLGQVGAFNDLVIVADNLGASEEAGSERYLAQAVWLTARIQVPLVASLNLAADLIQRLGPEDDRSPWIAAAAAILVMMRSAEHPDAEQLQQGVSALLGRCAEAREVPPDDFNAWLEREDLLNPDKAFPTLSMHLEALIDDAWLFDRSVFARTESTG